MMHGDSYDDNAGAFFTAAKVNWGIDTGSTLATDTSKLYKGGNES
jgi:hypothetical protein